MRHITIGPEFFAKAKNDYANEHWAIIREFFQNCIDSGASTIDVTVGEHDGDTELIVANDGKCMTEEIIVGKLLALGSSGKNFAGTTGGFGKAKEILYFCHKSYSIESGQLLVTGSGGTYELEISEIPYHGTRSTILMDDSCSTKLLEAIDKFIEFAEWPGTFNINGVSRRARLNKGQQKREFDFGVAYTSESPAERLVVRINGIPMFTTNTQYDKCVIIELKGQSDKTLTSNRDGLTWPHSSALNDFVTMLATNGSAIEAGIPLYIRYSGSKFSTIKANKVSAVQIVTGEVAAKAAAVAMQSPQTSVLSSGRISVSHNISPIGHDFIIKNQLNSKVPAYYDPGSGVFSPYSMKLARMWGRIILRLYEQFAIESYFSIGFVFSDKCEAQYENGEDYGVVYYINPCKVVGDGNNKQLKRMFKLTERDRILTLATHEFVHGLGCRYHDEKFANVLTDVFAKVMEKRKEYNWCFR